MMPWATVRQTPRRGCYQPIYMTGVAELSHTANASSTVDSTGLDRMLVFGPRWRSGNVAYAAELRQARCGRLPLEGWQLT